ncbi:pentatricopeptide repeat-containing protein At5g59600-like isoform X2 [Punica granatum]|uniref:Pentatricopeptide repeat-containing protein At5g59600-like isoform X2 n=1 Tax=Punica granatum TaxID=22663 RepID=A0A6P8E4E1_PUNGR|nr:pentatricopeptide repeat-containing protein At5g59600-like isoform X2 [Punica granatum]
MACESLSSGRALHARLIVNGPPLPTHIACKLIAFYVQFGQFAEARHSFDGIPQTEPRRWTALLSAFTRQGHHDEALRAFREMQRHGTGPVEFVLPSILKSCGRLRDLRAGECMHAIVEKRSMEDDPFVSCGLVDMYLKCGLVGRARQVFEGMPVKDLAVLNALVSGYARHGLMQEALELVENVRSAGLNPDLVTWNSIIAGFSRKGDASMFPKVFMTMMIDGFEPDVVSWTSVISGFVQNFWIRDAFRTFAEMMARGILPNSATISSILPACASLADLRRGKEIHGHAIVIGVETDVFVRSALVDMYAKCGLISHAKISFDQISERSSVSWNTMIFGLANNGYCNEAIETFAQMEKEDRGRIDHLTFTAALTACSHGGMIEFGKSLFKNMQEVYGIKPRLEHYACLVDLLGRGGNLMEAHNLIKAMPMEADMFVWGALLGACRMHGSIELAEVAARHLSELEPRSPGSGLLLSSLYANAGGWEYASQLKRMTRRRKMREFLGRTWIEAMG